MIFMFVLRGEQKYKVWKKQSDRLSPLLSQDILDIYRSHRRKDIVDIERMSSFELADFSPIGIDLIIGAFTLDILSLLGPHDDTTVFAYLILAHLILLTGVLASVILCQQANPEDYRSKRSNALFAIGLGVVAMMIAFFVIGGT